MREETKNLLEDVIVKELEILTYLDPNDEKSIKTNNDVINLCKVLIENDKVELDFAERRDKREAEAKEAKVVRENDERFKEEQLKDQKRDRYIKYGLEAASIGVPLIFYGIWMNRGFRFEETGTFTSTTFRGLFGQFRPKR